MSSNSLNPQKSLRLYENRVLTYDLDLLSRQTLIKVRLKIQEDEQSIPNPIPPLLAARLSENRTWEAPSRRGLEPRNFTACFQSLANPNKETNYTVYNPYRPGLAQWKELAQELIDYEGVLAVAYKGESHDRNLQEFAK